MGLFFFREIRKIFTSCIFLSKAIDINDINSFFLLPSACFAVFVELYCNKIA